jgi:hypothetical protein
MSSNELKQKLISLLFGTAYARVEPPILKGDSGVRHPFSILVRTDEKYHAVDIYNHVGEVEVLRSYIKMYDTHASGHIISSTDISAEARSLAAQYSVAISTVEGVEGEISDHESVTFDVCALDAHKTHGERRGGD